MLLLSSAYLAPIQYYAHLYADPAACEDRSEHFVKQTYRNRCYIATPTGPLALTIPVERSAERSLSHTPMADVRISDHGNWRHLHWQALVSAYENTPYFIYYADDLRPLYERSFERLTDFNAALRDTILALLSLSPALSLTTRYEAVPPTGTTDLRSLISPKVPLAADTAFTPQPYYQVFADRTGFLPNLSIVDLLFNLGPESRMVLKASMGRREVKKLNR